MCPHVAIVARLLHIGQYLAHGLFLEMGACLYRYSFAMFPGDAVPGATFANTNVAGKFQCRELPFAGCLVLGENSGSNLGFKCNKVEKLAQFCVKRAQHSFLLILII